MTSRATPTEKAARLLDLVPYIYSHQGIALADLAVEFSITEAELLADLNTLWMCGESRFDLIELEFDSGFVYIRNADAVNIVRSLSVQEATSILFGLDLLKESIPQERTDLLQDIQEIKTKIGEPFKRSIVGEPKIPADVLTALQESLSKRQKLKITYHSLAEDLLTDRIIHPIATRVEDGVDLLHAFCERADGLRTFRIDRIHSAQVLDQLVRDEAGLLKTELQSVDIKVHFDQRRIFETLGNLSPNNDGSYAIAIFNESWLIREVLASAGAIEVLRPLELRAEIARQACDVLSQYR